MVDDETGENCSIRSVEDIERDFKHVNQIWSVALINFELISIIRLTVPNSVLTELINGNYDPFIRYSSNQNLISGNNYITAVYSHKIGGMNGSAVSAKYLYL